MWREKLIDHTVVVLTESEFRRIVDSLKSAHEVIEMNYDGPIAKNAIGKIERLLKHFREWPHDR